MPRSPFSRQYRLRARLYGSGWSAGRIIAATLDPTVDFDPALRALRAEFLPRQESSRQSPQDPTRRRPRSTPPCPSTWKHPRPAGLQTAIASSPHTAKAGHAGCETTGNEGYLLGTRVVPRAAKTAADMHRELWLPRRGAGDVLRQCGKSDRDVMRGDGIWMTAFRVKTEVRERRRMLLRELPHRRPLKQFLRFAAKPGYRGPFSRPRMRCCGISARSRIVS